MKAPTRSYTHNQCHACCRHWPNLRAYLWMSSTVQNFAMMGICCGENGLLTLTDDDVVEKSNLSRQVVCQFFTCYRVPSLLRPYPMSTPFSCEIVDCSYLRCCNESIWDSLPINADNSNFLFGGWIISFSSALGMWRSSRASAPPKCAKHRWITRSRSRLCRLVASPLYLIVYLGLLVNQVLERVISLQPHLLF